MDEKQSGRVGSDAVKNRVPQRKLACKPSHDIPAYGQKGVKEDHDEKVNIEGIADDQRIDQENGRYGQQDNPA
jgi:hypothetical protein